MTSVAPVAAAKPGGPTRKSGAAGRPSAAAWLVAVPFLAFVGIFLVYPTVLVLFGAFQDSTGAFTLDNWHALVETNLMSVVYGCHTMVGWLKENPGRARVINVSSIASQLSLPCMAAYCAAKSGVSSFRKHCASRWRSSTSA